VQFADRCAQVLEVGLDAFRAVLTSVLADAASALERLDDAVAHRLLVRGHARDASAVRKHAATECPPDYRGLLAPVDPQSFGPTRAPDEVRVLRRRGVLQTSGISS
jgi:hypothetical protein